MLFSGTSVMATIINYELIARKGGMVYAELEDAN